MMKKIILPLFLLLFIGVTKVYAQNKDPNKWDLQDCVNYALENNLDIKKYKLSESDAQVDKIASLGAFLPTINFGMNHSWNNGLTQNITTGLLQNTTTQYTSLNSSLGVLIFNGLQNIRRLHRANLQILAKRYDLEDMKDNVTLLVVSSYVQVLFDKESVKTAKYALSIVDADVKKVNVFVESGALPEGDLLELNATFSESEQKVQQAENALRISKLNLSQLLNLNDVDIEDSDENVVIKESKILLTPPDDIYEKSLEVRNNIKVAQLNLKVSEKNLQISKGGYLPTLRGNVNYGTRASYADRVVGRALNNQNPTTTIGTVSGTNQNVVVPNYNRIVGIHEDIFKQFENNDGLSFGLNLSIPILSGFNIRTRVKKSKISIERQKYNLDKMKLDLKSKVYKAWNDLKDASKAFDYAKKTQLARSKAFDYAKYKFEQGTIQIFEYIQVLQRFETAKRNLIVSKYNLIFKTKILKYYFGIPIDR